MPLLTGFYGQMTGLESYVATNDITLGLFSSQLFIFSLFANVIEMQLAEMQTCTNTELEK